MICGDRVKQARELQGMTQEQLASAVGVNRTTITLLELGTIQPAAETLERLAFHTRFPPSFFRQPPGADFPLGSLEFRARALSAPEKKRVHRHAEVYWGVAEALAAHMKPRRIKLPRVSAGPEAAAGMARACLGLAPDKPIPHVLHALEAGGVLVLALPFGMTSGDAFSAWVGRDGDKPVIVLAGHSPGYRIRFSAAHELAHLALLPPTGTAKEIERASDKFAGAFLLPAVAMREELLPPVTLASLEPLKRRWKVALQVLIMRAEDLDIITPRQTRYLFQRLNARGWLTHEPGDGDIAPEQPQAIRQMAQMLYGDPVDYRKLADDTHLSPPFVRELLRAHGADLSEGPANVVRFRPRGAAQSPEP